MIDENWTVVSLMANYPGFASEEQADDYAKNILKLQPGEYATRRLTDIIEGRGGNEQISFEKEKQESP